MHHPYILNKKDFDLVYYYIRNFFELHFVLQGILKLNDGYNNLHLLQYTLARYRNSNQSLFELGSYHLVVL